LLGGVDEQVAHELRELRQGGERRQEPAVAQRALTDVGGGNSALKDRDLALQCVKTNKTTQETTTTETTNRYHND
jgi:hypothetical protein